MSKRVFISHSSKDFEIAKGLTEYLEQSNISCWIAPRDIQAGEAFAKSIISALSTVEVFIILYTKNADESVQVQKEVDRAVNRNIPIIPFKIDEFEACEAMEYYLCNTHWLNAFPNNPSFYFDQLLGRVNSILNINIESEEIDQDEDISNEERDLEGIALEVDLKISELEEDDVFNDKTDTSIDIKAFRKQETKGPKQKIHKKRNLSNNKKTLFFILICVITFSISNLFKKDKKKKNTVFVKNEKVENVFRASVFKNNSKFDKAYKSLQHLNKDKLEKRLLGHRNLFRDTFELAPNTKNIFIHNLDGEYNKDYLNSFVILEKLNSKSNQDKICFSYNQDNYDIKNFKEFFHFISVTHKTNVDFPYKYIDQKVSKKYSEFYCSKMELDKKITISLSQGKQIILKNEYESYKLDSSESFFQLGHEFLIKLGVSDVSILLPESEFKNSEFSSIIKKYEGLLSKIITEYYKIGGI